MAASVAPAEQPSVPKRYMTYRNFVKALPLLTSVREIMNDPRYDVWFVNFSSAVQANHSLSHVPVCEANMTAGACGAAHKNHSLPPQAAWTRCSSRRDAPTSTTTRC